MGQTQGKETLSHSEHARRLKQHQRRAEVGPDAAPEDRPDAPFSLRAVTVADFVATQQPLITTTAAATVGETRALLNERGIQSVPVLSATGEYLGILSLVDLADYLLWYQDEHRDAPEAGLAIPLHRILGLYDANDALKVRTTDTLRDVVKLMKQRRAHRLLVQDPAGAVVAVITQMGLLRILHENVDDLYDQPAATLASLGLAAKPLVTCTTTDPALGTLQRLRDAHISGLGVVDGQGRLVGELSLAAVRALDEEHTAALRTATVGALMGERPPLTCGPDTALRQVVAMLHTQRQYRVFVVDNERRPVGVVTLTDCLLHVSKR
eukprot:comp21700_c0_seq1/m.30623 comp21700_c0_seq1/g.30623  ORF comp21700_c0_seq1/g.30623 comp21700_c0_seq1/m.30623 type:complete len:324 (-) comp21700_c0_seq1:213-1184(-)